MRWPGRSSPPAAASTARLPTGMVLAFRRPRGGTVGRPGCARRRTRSRSREYGSLAKGIDLSVLTPEEAFQLVTSRRKPASKDEEEPARELAKDLGYHALALDLTA